jgi:hypothetical protein
VTVTIPSGMTASGLTPLLAAYGAGSPLLWWSVTVAGVLLLVAAVFLLREPATAVEGSGASEHHGADESEPQPRGEPAEDHQRSGPPAG